MRSAEIFEKLNRPNDGTRSLFESLAIPEVELALKDWAAAEQHCVLIGGCAVGFYGRPRATTDVDVLFLTDAEIPDSVPRFKHTHPHAFQHNPTHVEVELVTPELVGVSEQLVQVVFVTAVKSDGMLVASPSGLVALKLGRWSRQDQADIETLMQLHPITLENWPLTHTEQQRFHEAQTWNSNPIAGES